MKITPVKGTADYLPNEVLIRDYLQNSILETYRSCGFERISTPVSYTHLSARCSRYRSDVQHSCI